jgi:hypothetical protein
MAALLQLTSQDIERLPNYRKKTAKEWSSTCPQCGGKDRFLFWPDVGNYECYRGCGLKGFVTDAPGADLFRITPEMKAEWERQRLEREREEHERHMSAIERLQDSARDTTYHNNLRIQPELYDFIDAAWGLNRDTCNRFRLGYCNTCPTYQQSDSIAIPYYWRGKLINLRHRLIQPADGGKYRPEMTGLQTAIFNAERLDSPLEWLVLVEGEFKAAILEQFGLPAVGIPGATNFKDKWVRLFSQVDRVYVTLDPGVEDQAAGIGTLLARGGVDSRLVTVPVKPDDMLTIYDVTPAEFRQYLKLGAKC